MPNTTKAIGFNTQPPKGGWVSTTLQCLVTWVSTHSRLKAAGHRPIPRLRPIDVSTHSRLKAAGFKQVLGDWVLQVSTHSRLKAAGTSGMFVLADDGFQHTAA